MTLSRSMMTGRPELRPTYHSSSSTRAVGLPPRRDALRPRHRAAHTDAHARRSASRGPLSRSRWRDLNALRWRSESRLRDLDLDCEISTDQAVRWRRAGPGLVPAEARTAEREASGRACSLGRISGGSRADLGSCRAHLRRGHVEMLRARELAPREDALQAEHSGAAGPCR